MPFIVTHLDAHGRACHDAHIPCGSNVRQLRLFVLAHVGACRITFIQCCAAPCLHLDTLCQLLATAVTPLDLELRVMCVDDALQAVHARAHGSLAVGIVQATTTRAEHRALDAAMMAAASRAVHVCFTVIAPVRTDSKLI